MTLEDTLKNLLKPFVILGVFPMDTSYLLAPALGL